MYRLHLGRLGGIVSATAILAMSGSVALSQGSSGGDAASAPKGDSTIWVIKPRVYGTAETPGADAAPADSVAADAAEPQQDAPNAPETADVGEDLSVEADEAPAPTEVAAEDAAAPSDAAEPVAGEAAAAPDEPAMGDAGASGGATEEEAVPAAEAAAGEDAPGDAAAEPSPGAEAAAGDAAAPAETDAATAETEAAASGDDGDATAAEARAAVEPEPDEGVGAKGPIEPEESAILPSAEDQTETKAQTMAIDCVKRPEGCITPLDTEVRGPVLSVPGGEGAGVQVIARP